METKLQDLSVCKGIDCPGGCLDDFDHHCYVQQVKSMLDFHLKNLNQTKPELKN